MQRHVHLASETSKATRGGCCLTRTIFLRLSVPNDMAALPQLIHYHVKLVILDRTKMPLEVLANLQTRRYINKCCSCRISPNVIKVNIPPQFKHATVNQEGYGSILEMSLGYKKQKTMDQFFGNAMTKITDNEKNVIYLENILTHFLEHVFWHAFENLPRYGNVVLFENYRECIPVKDVIEWQVIVVGHDNCRKTQELLLG